MSSSKVVELPLEEFEQLTKKLNAYKDEITDLKAVIKFQNEQVAEYNNKFSKDSIDGK